MIGKKFKKKKKKKNLTIAFNALYAKNEKNISCLENLTQSEKNELLF